jgi:hypothetical protein
MEVGLVQTKEGSGCWVTLMGVSVLPFKTSRLGSDLQADWWSAVMVGRAAELRAFHPISVCQLCANSAKLSKSQLTSKPYRQGKGLCLDVIT